MRQDPRELRPRLRLLPLWLAAQLAIAPATTLAGTVENVPGLEGTRGEICVTNTPGGGVEIVQKSPDAQAIWTELPQSLDIRQPSANSRLLNEVHSESGTFFNGELTANGIIYLTDVLGITIGPEARIEAARFLAAAGFLSWQDFMSGDDRFMLTGHVEHQGVIEAGSVTLAGRSVASHGDIFADDMVVMVAGDEAWIRERGSPVVVKLDLPEGDAAPLPDVADAGGLGAGDALAYTLRQTGEVRARTIALESAGLVEVAGTLDASNTTPGATGGDVSILGDAVKLTGARVDASGAAGGGRVHIGGDYQGSGDVRTSRVTYLDAQSEVRADALDAGDGGELIVWSDGTTLTRAALSARGGPNGGDGGFAEVSGKRFLDLHLFPDVTAPMGDGGALLFDPNNITIVRNVGTDPDDDPTNLDSAFERLLDPEFVENNPGAEIRPNTDDSKISSSLIEQALRLGVDIRIVTDTFELEQGDQAGNITFESDAYMSFTDDAGSGAPIQVGTEALLELSAANDIIIEGQVLRPEDAGDPPASPIKAIDNQSVNLTLDLVFTANDANRAESDQPIDTSGVEDNFNLGDLELLAPLNSGGGDVELNGFNVTVAAAVETEGGSFEINGDVDQFPAGNVTLTSDAPIATDGGDVVIFAQSLELIGEATDGSPRFSESTIDLGAPIDTTSTDSDPEAVGGSVTIVGEGSDLYIAAPITSAGGNISLRSRTKRFTDPDDDTIVLADRGGSMRLLAPLSSGRGLDSIGGAVSVTGNDIVVMADITSEGGEIFFDDSGSITFETTDRLVINADLVSRGGSITFGDVAGIGRVELGLADADPEFPGQGQPIEIDALDSADPELDGSVVINGRADVVSQQPTTIRGGAVVIASGGDGEGDIELTQSGDTIHGDTITLIAGDGITLPVPEDPDEPTPPNDTGRIALASDIELRDSTGMTAPERFLFVQDAAIGDDEVVPLSTFGGTVPEVYRLESSDHDVDLGSAGTDRLIGTDLTVAFRTGVSFTGLAASSLALEALESLTVDAALAQEIDGLESLRISSGDAARVEIVGSGDADNPDQSEVTGDLVIEAGVVLTTTGTGDDGGLTLHAGRNGYGDLTVGSEGDAPVFLLGETVTLRAGDGPTFDDISETDEALNGRRNSAIDIAPEVAFRNVDGLASPTRFELRQDAAITDANLPTAGQFATLAGLEYSIRSDDGSATLFETDDSSVFGTDLSVAALAGITFANDLRVASADVGGIEDFEVTSDLISRIQIAEPGGTKKLVLRAGLSPDVEGDLRFGAGVVVAADELRLIAGPSNPTLSGAETQAVLSSVDLVTNAPMFVGADGNGTPDRFLMRQADSIEDSELPTAASFGDPADSANPMRAALRSDNADIDITASSIGVESAELIFSASRVLIGDSETTEDTILTGEYRTNQLAARAFLSSDDEDDAPDPEADAIVDASEISLGGFDSGLDDELKLVDPEFDFDLVSPVAAQIFTLLQDGTFEAATQLPTQSLAGTEVQVLSDNGSIDLRNLPQVGGVDILTGAGLGLTIGNDTGTIDFPSTLDLENLDVQMLGALEVGSEGVTTTISATQGIGFNVGQTGQLEPTNEGEPGDPANLTFAGDVLLRANRIVLQAGDGFVSTDYPTDDEGSWPTEVPSVNVANARFEFTDGLPAIPEMDDEASAPSFVLVQDANVDMDDLPSGSTVSISGAFDSLESYTVVSREGSVESDPDTDVVTAEATIVFDDYIETSPDFQTDSFELGATAVQISTDGTLRFDPGDPVLDIAADRIELVGSEVLAQSDANLVLSGLVDENSSPGFFFIRQDAPITSANLPDRSQFVGGTTGVGYGLISQAGVVAEGSDFADRVLNSNLLLSAEAGDVRIAQDLFLGSLTVLASGEIQIDTDFIVTTGNGFGVDAGRSRDQRYLAPVVIEERIGPLFDIDGDPVLDEDGLQRTGSVPLTLTGVGIEFGATVDGNSPLVVGATEQIAFRADVGESTRLLSLRAETRGERSEAGDLFTIEFGGIQDESDFLNLELDQITQTPLPDSATMAASSITVRTHGDIGLNLGDEVDFNGIAQGVRDEVPETATITQPSGDLTFVSEAGNFDVGRIEKITAARDLAITSAGRARFGDLTGRTLAVTAPSIQILRREAGDVAQAGGGSVRDAGVDLLGNSITFVGTPSVFEDGRNPVFGLQDPRVLPGSVIDIGLFPIAAIKEDSSALVPADVLDAEGRVLDLLPLGPSRADFSGASPEFDLPGPLVRGPVRARLVNRELLPLVGIDAREETRDEYRRRLSGAGVYDDVGEVQPFAHLSTLRVVEARLRPGEAKRAVALFEEVFGADGTRADEVRQVLQRIVDDYRATTGARRVVGFELRRFVRNRPSSQFEAYTLLEKLDALFRHHRRLGLTPGEYRVIQQRWLERITPSGISLDELAETIHPSRYVRGSDILDIFGD